MRTFFDIFHYLIHRPGVCVTLKCDNTTQASTFIATHKNYIQAAVDSITLFYRKNRQNNPFGVVAPDYLLKQLFLDTRAKLQHENYVVNGNTEGLRLDSPTGCFCPILFRPPRHNVFKGHQLSGVHFPAEFSTKGWAKALAHHVTREPRSLVVVTGEPWRFLDLIEHSVGSQSGAYQIGNIITDLIPKNGKVTINVTAGNYETRRPHMEPRIRQNQ